MAPFMGPSRAAVLKLLRGRAPERKLPLTLGEYEPQATLQREGGRWLLRQLVLNQARADAARELAMRHDGMWMPEMQSEFLEPGPALAEAATAGGLADAIERLRWTFGDGEP